MTTVRAIQEANFKLYTQTPFYFLKWYFGHNKSSYFGWAKIYWFSIVSLDKLCPDVYNEFQKGTFSFLKPKSSVSRVTITQLQKQNKKVIKGISGATSEKKARGSALICCVLKGPKLSEMMEESEYRCSDSDRCKDHYNCSDNFQVEFANDIQKNYENFSTRHVHQRQTYYL